MEWSEVAETDPASPVALASLARIVGSFGEPNAAKVVKVPSNYLNDWRRFKRGDSAGISPQAVRALCWDPAVASDDQFAAVVGELALVSPRQIQGLVYSLHRLWSREVIRGKMRALTEGYIAGY